MKTLIFDIETIGERWEDLDEQTRGVVEKAVGRKAEERGLDMEVLLAQEQEELGLSPLTGEIVSVGVLDAETEKGAVYFRAPGADVAPFEEDDVKYEAMDEAGILAKFWEIARYAQTFVTFNGRSFDVPYLMIRSAVHRIKPTKDLMRGRYLYQCAANAQHVDLKEQLTFYGATFRRHSLHLYCRAFGIETPKDGMDGSEVGEYFRRGDFLDIARYNARDIRATKALYDVWREYVQVGNGTS
ncbi:MAG: ribonuclease H-like domain-containing protein [bacterium]|nr:ribonuclease H-like domain-containing protein [bacterium]